MQEGGREGRPREEGQPSRDAVSRVAHRSEEDAARYERFRMRVDELTDSQSVSGRDGREPPPVKQRKRICTRGCFSASSTSLVFPICKTTNGCFFSLLIFKSFLKSHSTSLGTWMSAFLSAPTPQT